VVPAPTPVTRIALPFKTAEATPPFVLLEMNTVEPFPENETFCVAPTPRVMLEGLNIGPAVLVFEFVVFVDPFTDTLNVLHPPEAWQIVIFVEPEPVAVIESVLPFKVSETTLGLVFPEMK
jgi:hypothetical protein